MKVKQMLVFNFIFDLLRTSRSSSVRSVDVLMFREINWIENRGVTSTKLTILNFTNV